MSAAAKTHEPSMEEILASIRRIIADDQENGGQPGARPNGPESGDATPPDDILDLADLKPEPVVTSLDREFAAVDMSSDEPEESPPPPNAAAPEPTVATPATTAGEPIQPAPAADAGSIGPARAATGPAEPQAPSVQAAPAEAMGATRPSLESLISNEATASVGQAFNVLSHTVLSRNARTLEDLVQDMLKPMLRAWLDDNLPPLVERLVRAEIERVARGRG